MGGWSDISHSPLWKGRREKDERNFNNHCFGDVGDVRDGVALSV